MISSPKFKSGFVEDGTIRYSSPSLVEVTSNTISDKKPFQEANREFRKLAQ